MLQDFSGFDHASGTPGPEHDRILRLDKSYAAARERLPELCDLAVAGLKRMALPDLRFPQTMRSNANQDGSGTAAEGDSLRYAINAGQGLNWTSDATQRQVLAGRSAVDLVLACARRAHHSRDPGAVALAAWAAAETAKTFTPELFSALEDWLTDGSYVETVSCAWALSAAVAARHLGDVREVQRLATRNLEAAQADCGLFPHVMPARAARWGRGHVGCFADQVYPIQALARLGYGESDEVALYAANACAAAIVALQGPAGQWWWHYDVRDGSVVEGYPVYSVHQHAMAPMALLDLQEAGGTDHRAAVVKGLAWIDQRPETGEPMVSEADGVIWRKVGRSEPPKLARTLAAATTAIRAGWHLPGLDAAMPPGKVDRECRPYEFGWMLYAWRARGVVQALRRDDR